MRKSISAKILSLVAILILTGLVTSILWRYSIKNMNDKAQTISTECLQAVSILAETSRSVERVQKFANNSMNGMDFGTVNETQVDVENISENQSMMIVMDDSSENMEQEREQLEEMFSQLESIVSGFNRADMTVALQEYEAAFQSYSTMVNQAFGMDNTNIDVTDTTSQLDSAYEKLYSLIYEQVDIASQELTNEYNISYTVNSVLFLSILALAIIIVLVTIITIVRPIKNVHKQLQLI